MSDTTTCETKGCEREARMAIKTTRPNRPGLQSTVYFDDRGAPKTAVRYCKPCGVKLLGDLGRTLVADNSEEEMVETTSYVFSAKGLRMGMHRDAERDVENVVDAIRGFAFPKEVKRINAPCTDEFTLIIEFTIEAHERETHEYMEEIRNALLSTIVSNDYTIEPVT